MADSDSSTQPVPYQMPMHMMGSNIIYMTNPSQELYRFELSLRGKMENSEGEVVNVGEPLMNEKGINTVLGLLRSVVNQVNIMGNLSKQQVPGMMEFFSDAVIKNLMMNRDRYEMTEMARDQVWVSATNLAFFTMQRALDEGDRRFWSKITQEIKSTVDSTSRNKSGGLLSSLNPWNKN